MIQWTWCKWDKAETIIGINNFYEFRLEKFYSQDTVILQVWVQSQPDHLVQESRFPSFDEAFAFVRNWYD